MFEPVLSLPKRKKRSLSKHADEEPAPFPIPISSLTGRKASLSSWNHFRGQFRAGSDAIRVWGDHEVWSKLDRGGSFGRFSGTQYRSLKRQAAAAASDHSGALVKVVHDADPQIFDCIQKDRVVAAPSTASADDVVEVSQANQEDEGDYILSFEEAYFLSFALGCLMVTDDASGNDLNLEQMWETFSRAKPDFWSRYAVYHHFRSKGWVVRPGTKFGADYLLYKESPAHFHASYSVVVQNDTAGDKQQPRLSWLDLSGLNRVTETASKELLIAHVVLRKPLAGNASEEVRADNWMRLVEVKEVLIRRWVPSAERELAEDNHLKRNKAKRQR